MPEPPELPRSASTTRRSRSDADHRSITIAIVTALCVGLLPLAACSSTGSAKAEDPSVTNRPAARPSAVDSTADARPSATDPPAPAGTTSTTTPSTTIDPADEPFSLEQREVINAYRAAMNAIMMAGKAPEADPRHPLLAATMVGPALDRAQKAVEDHRVKGVVVRPPDDSEARIVPLTVEVDDRRAILTVCSIDDAIQYLAATGEVVDDDVSVTHISAELRRIDGVWKLLIRDLLDQVINEEASCDTTS